MNQQEPPSRSKKLRLIVLGVVGLAVVNLLGFTWWVSMHGKGLMKQTVNEVSEGRNYGEGKDTDACLEEYFQREEECLTPICTVKHSLFLNGCLLTAQLSTGVCQGVPRSDEIIDASTYTMKQCVKWGKPPDNDCQQAARAILTRCEQELSPR